MMKMVLTIFGIALIVMFSMIFQLQQTDYVCEPNITMSPSYKIVNPVLAQHQKNIASPEITPYKDIQKILMENNAIDDWGDFSGNSMQPTLFEGNIVLSNLITDDTVLKPGMIIRYTTLNKTGCEPIQNSQLIDVPYIIHRIVSVHNDNTIITGGDNNNFVEKIKRCQITHVIVGVVYT